MTSQSNSNSLIKSSEYFPDDSKELRIKLTEMYSKISSSLNYKENGLYDLSEQLTGQQFYNLTNINNKRSSFRKTFPFDAISAGLGLNIDHGITGITQCTFIGGCCITDMPDFRSIPWSSAIDVTNNISVRVTSTQIIINNGAGAPNIVSGFITLEYLKN